MHVLHVHVNLVFMKEGSFVQKTFQVHSPIFLKMTLKLTTIILVVFFIMTSDYFVLTEVMGYNPNTHPIPSTKSPKTHKPTKTTASAATTVSMGPLGLLSFDYFIIVVSASGIAFIILVSILCIVCCRKPKTTYADMTRAEIEAGLTPSMIDEGLTKSMITPRLLPPPAPVTPQASPFRMPPVIPVMMPPPIPYCVSPPNSYGQYPPVPGMYPGIPPSPDSFASRDKVRLPKGVVLPRALRGVTPKNR